jgi:Uma2 family endonuclease
MGVRENVVSVEEFLKVAEAEPERRLELIDGMIVEMPPSRRKNTVMAARFIGYLHVFLTDKDMGYVTSPDGGFQLNEETLLMPDVAFIRKERVATLEGVEFDSAPDLAIEVISPSESPRAVTDKTRKYLDAGTLMVWNAFPDSKTVDAWRSADDGEMRVKTYTVGDTLDGGDVLPGFQLPLKNIFRD